MRVENSSLLPSFNIYFFCILQKNWSTLCNKKQTKKSLGKTACLKDKRFPMFLFVVSWFPYARTYSPAPSKSYPCQISDEPKEERTSKTMEFNLASFLWLLCSSKLASDVCNTVEVVYSSFLAASKAVRIREANEMKSRAELEQFFASQLLSSIYCVLQCWFIASLNKKARLSSSSKQSDYSGN